MSQYRQDVLIRQLQGALGGCKVVRGTFNSSAVTAVVIDGEGWTVARTASPGAWEVTFDPPFSGPPSVVWDVRSANYRHVQHGAAATASLATVNCYTSAAAAADANEIHFIAIGPA